MIKMTCIRSSTNSHVQQYILATSALRKRRQRHKQSNDAHFLYIWSYLTKKQAGDNNRSSLQLDDDQYDAYQEFDHVASSSIYQLPVPQEEGDDDPNQLKNAYFLCIWYCLIEKQAENRQKRESLQPDDDRYDAYQELNPVASSSIHQLPVLQKEGDDDPIDQRTRISRVFGH